jgi:succinyl-CoA synthetase alpha subunit
LGMMGGNAKTAKDWFHKGSVGIMSRSGGLSASTGYYICQTGIGISTICHVGGDAVIGLTFPEIAEMFENDDETDLIVMLGEIGGSQEEQVADLVESGKITKPIVAYIGGKAAQSGTRYSHAGAIIEGGKGTWAGKIDRLNEVDVTIVEQFGDIPKMIQSFKFRVQN